MKVSWIPCYIITLKEMFLRQNLNGKEWKRKEGKKNGVLEKNKGVMDSMLHQNPNRNVFPANF